MLVILTLLACHQPSSRKAGSDGAPSTPEVGAEDIPSELADCGEDLNVFKEHVWDPVLGQQCVGCHVDGGPAGGSALILDPEDMLVSLRAASAVSDRLVEKPAGLHPQGHGGGTLIQEDNAAWEALSFWVEWTQGVCEPPTTNRLCFEDPVPRRLRRLSHAEYDRTVQDLLGVDLAAAQNFAADNKVRGFDNDASALRTGPVLAGP